MQREREQIHTPWYEQIKGEIKRAQEALAAPVPKSSPTIPELLQKNPEANIFCDICKHALQCHFLKKYKIQVREKRHSKIKFIGSVPKDDIKKYDQKDSHNNITVKEGIYPCDKIKNLDLSESCYCDLETRIE